jgi:hypothetical protein
MHGGKNGADSRGAHADCCGIDIAPGGLPRADKKATGRPTSHQRAVGRHRRRHGGLAESAMVEIVRRRAARHVDGRSAEAIAGTRCARRTRAHGAGASRSRARERRAEHHGRSVGIAHAHHQSTFFRAERIVRWGWNEWFVGAEFRRGRHHVTGLEHDRTRRRGIPLRIRLVGEKSRRDSIGSRCSIA